MIFPYRVLASFERNQPIKPVRCFVIAMLVLPCAMIVAGAGCTRAYYRREADAEVAAAVDEKAVDSETGFAEFGVERGPESRLFDPYDPDYPPLPPDDPTSHELMHAVDGKRGYKYWHRDGDAPSVDAGTWRRHLPRDEAGRVVLDRASALQVALDNSRDYQSELEDLYLSALDVTFQRFRFDTQFFAGNSIFFTADGRERLGSGGESSSQFSTVTDLELRKLTATGGELVVGLANSIVWQFSGPTTNVGRTLLDFGFVQPLLRFGGRARVLEGLTLAERNLLANVRQLQQFQQGFVVDIVTGRNSGAGPSRRGTVGAAGLGLLAGTPSGRTGAAGASGFLGLLQELQEIRNQEANVSALRDSVAQLDAAFEAGQLNNHLQVDQARQALYNGQSSLLSAKAAFQTRLDDFKVQLGLPPDVDLTLNDPYLDQFNLIGPAITGLQDQVGAIRAAIYNKETTGDIDALRTQLERFEKLRDSVGSQFETAERDSKQLDDQLPTRREQLQNLKTRPEFRDGSVDRNVYEEQALDKRVEQLKSRLAKLKQQLATMWESVPKLKGELAGLELDLARRRCAAVGTQFSGLLLELMLNQAGSRLESVVLAPVQMEPTLALEVARENRLDWMNARARLVDAWRQIRFTANALDSGLNLFFEGDIRTTNNNPVDLRDSTGRLRLGLEFDTPLTRLAERNNYRETLIEYQRARRDYMLFEDRINQSLRNTLRIVELSQLNFELQRSAVQVAISQVDLARLRLTEPPRPGQAPQFGATTARDLVSGLSDLLNAQNDFLNVWVSYEVLRMLLDFEMGTMQLNSRGMWIDPGPIFAEKYQTRSSARTSEPEIPPAPAPADGSAQPPSDE